MHYLADAANLPNPTTRAPRTLALKPRVKGAGPPSHKRFPLSIPNAAPRLFLRCRDDRRSASETSYDVSRG